MIEHKAGEPAPVTRTRFGIPREEIGAPDCPLMHRWTLLDLSAWKLLVHHFLPNASDTDYHDHPRSFLTVVIYGGYTDRTPWGVVDALRAGSIRFRDAEHAHITTVGPRGCWTVVVMGPKRRKWGFWRDGKWWHWQAFEREFGLAMRCDRDA